jgi:hypothetical protein
VTVFYAKCLEHDLPANLQAGWRECGRSWVPSCFTYSVLLEWHGENPPAIARTL